jgi:hypothetical protein
MEMPMDNIRGDSQIRSDDGEIESHIHLSAGRAEPPAEPVSRTDDPDRFKRFGDRAESFAGRVKEPVQDGLRRVTDALDEHTGVLDFVRRQPLAAVGVAISVGFVAGVASSTERRHPVLEEGRLRLKTLILSGVSAFLAQELRAAIEENHGFGNLVQSLFDDDGDLLDDVDEDDDDGHEA